MAYSDREMTLRTMATALETYASWIERDRREPDKLLCHVLSMRSAATHARVMADDASEAT